MAGAVGREGVRACVLACVRACVRVCKCFNVFVCMYACM